MCCSGDHPEARRRLGRGVVQHAPQPEPVRPAGAPLACHQQHDRLQQLHRPAGRQRAGRRQRPVGRRLVSPLPDVHLLERACAVDRQAAPVIAPAGRPDGRIGATTDCCPASFVSINKRTCVRARARVCVYTLYNKLLYIIVRVNQRELALFAP